MSDVAGLIERLERAESGSRLLDCDIQLIAVGDIEYRYATKTGWADGKLSQYVALYRANIDADESVHMVPRFTTVLHDALLLVPEEALWEVERKINITSDSFERPSGEPAIAFMAGVGTGAVPAKWTYGKHFTSPTLALCIAALRARGEP